MRKFKKWLVNKFLPMWAKETIIAENERLKKQIADLESKNSSLLSYINGLEAGIKAQRRIVINTGEARK